MTHEVDLRNFEPAAPPPEGAAGGSRGVEASPVSPARPVDDRMAVLPLWACREFERLRKERDEARAACERARDSACLYEQIIERLQHDVWMPETSDEMVASLASFGAYVVECPR